MKFNLSELEIIERLLINRLNADFDNEVDELLRKVRGEINNIRYQINRTIEWSKKK